MIIKKILLLALLPVLLLISCQQAPQENITPQEAGYEQALFSLLMDAYEGKGMFEGYYITGFSLADIDGCGVQEALLYHQAELYPEVETAALTCKYNEGIFSYLYTVPFTQPEPVEGVINRNNSVSLYYVEQKGYLVAFKSNQAAPLALYHELELGWIQADEMKAGIKAGYAYTGQQALFHLSEPQQSQMLENEQQYYLALQEHIGSDVLYELPCYSLEVADQEGLGELITVAVSSASNAQLADPLLGEAALLNSIKDYSTPPAQKGNEPGNWGSAGFVASNGIWTAYAGEEGIYMVPAYQENGIGEKIVSKMFPQYFNMSGEWLYYIVDGLIFRSSFDGLKQEQLSFFPEERCGHLAVEGDWVYYTNSSGENEIRRMKLDGSGKETIVQVQARNLQLKDGSIFFIQAAEHPEGGSLELEYWNYGHIYRIDPDGNNYFKVSDQFVSAMVAVQDIYYISSEDGSVGRIRHDTGENNKLAASKAYFINVNEDYLVFTDKDAALFLADTEGKSVKALEEGLHVRTGLAIIGQWVYFEQHDYDKGVLCLYRIHRSGGRAFLIAENV